LIFNAAHFAALRARLFFPLEKELSLPIILLGTRAICPWETFSFIGNELLRNSLEVNFMRVFSISARASGSRRIQN
jgi:hypothetical protein